MTRDDAWKSLEACYVAKQNAFMRDKATYAALGGRGKPDEPSKDITNATLLAIAFELREVAELLKRFDRCRNEDNTLLVTLKAGANDARRG